MKNKILLTIFIICFLASVILSIPQTLDSGFCDPDPEAGCNSVQNSKHGYIFGIKTANVGVFAFALLSILTFFQIKKPRKELKKIIITGIIIGAIIAFYFIYLQIFIFKKLCPYCMVADTGAIIALMVLIFWKRK